MNKGKKRFWALEIIADHFPDFYGWIRRYRSCRAYMEAAQHALESVPEDAIAAACRQLLYDDPIPNVRLPFVVARVARELLQPDMPPVQNEVRPTLHEQRQVVRDVLTALNWGHSDQNGTLGGPHNAGAGHNGRIHPGMGARE